GETQRATEKQSAAEIGTERPLGLPSAALRLSVRSASLRLIGEIRPHPYYSDLCTTATLSSRTSRAKSSCASVMTSGGEILKTLPYMPPTLAASMPRLVASSRIASAVFIAGALVLRSATTSNAVILPSPRTSPISG